MSTNPSFDPGLVAILAYDGLCTFEFGIAVELFGLPRPEFDFPWYRHQVVAIEDGPLRAMGGIRILADAGLDALAAARTIIVPGWRDRSELPSPALCEALRNAQAQGARLLSICSGVFVLAASGLLDGKRATTHWRYTEELARRYPAIRVEPDVLYVDEGSLITSAGSAAGIDACLHLIARDFGHRIANRVAQRLVTTPQRAGGQAQFIPSPVDPGARQDMAPLLDWARARLDQPLSIAMLAKQAAMSERTLLRRFVDVTGMPPKQWLQHARIGHARELLESGSATLEQIAARCGFHSAESFRKAFRAQVGLAPTAYRRRFGSTEAH